MQRVSSRLELRHLRYFLAVAQELHFGRAARRLGIAQSPLSQQIAQLEKLLGVALFDRGTQVQLTPAGKALLDAAGRILSLSERVPGVVVAAASGQSGVLSVGLSASASLGLIPPLFHEFRQKFPAVQLLLREGTSDNHLSDVEAGVLDLAVIRGSMRPGNSASVLLSCGPRKHQPDAFERDSKSDPQGIPTQAAMWCAATTIS